MPINSSSEPAAVNPLVLEAERCFCIPCGLWVGMRDEIQQHHTHDEVHSTHPKGTSVCEDTFAPVTQFKDAYPASKDASEPVYAALLVQVEYEYTSLMRAAAQLKPRVSHVNNKSMDRLPDTPVKSREKILEQPAIRCYISPSCDQEFENPDAADRHQQYFYCTWCKVDYAIQTKSHSGGKDMNGRPFCSICSLGFDDWSKYQTHLQVNPNHWYCPKCGTEFEVNDKRSDRLKYAPDYFTRTRFLKERHQRTRRHKVQIKRKFVPAAQGYSGSRKRPKNS